MSAASPVAPGQLIAGKYRVERVLGQGGMGIVVAAMHEQLERRVAIKFLLPEVASKPKAVKRFTREAKAAARIQSEHVARVLDVGKLKGGAAYMVMEYLEGRDLAATLAQQGKLAPDQAVDFILQACEALVEAHRVSIVHRDLKPSNLFITRRADGSPCVKLLDFGISKAAAPTKGEPALTTTNAVLGTPLYISPEQLVASRNVDARSDIWGLGVILYEVLAGVPPFEGDDIIQLAASILHRAPPSLRVVRADLPPALCDAVMRCLEKSAANRFGDVGELALALAPFAPHAGISVERITRILSARPAAIAASGSATASRRSPSGHPAGARLTPGAWDEDSTVGGRQSRAPKRVSWTLWVAILLGAGLLIGGVVARLSGGVQAGSMGVASPPANPSTGAAPLPAEPGSVVRSFASQEPAAVLASTAPAISIAAPSPEAGMWTPPTRATVSPPPMKRDP
jgi:serine/threonine protein kinase